MNNIKKEDLKNGDVFVYQSNDFNYLNKEGTGCHLFLNKNNKINSKILYKFRSFIYKNIRMGTPEEKHWLETCIKLDKFVEYDEAIKTFVKEFLLPENWYVQVTDENKKILSKWMNLNIDYLDRNSIVGMVKDNDGSISKGHNPSSIIKSNKLGYNYSYDFGTEITFKQFKKYVLKEIEIIKPLPFFKVVKITNSKSYFHKAIINEVENNEGNLFKLKDSITTIEGINKGREFKILSFRYNNDKTNICAVTDVHTPYGIGIDKIEHLIEKKSLIFILF